MLFVAGSAGCALSTSAEAMIGWRVPQAVGVCAGVVLASAMVRELFARDLAARNGPLFFLIAQSWSL